MDLAADLSAYSGGIPQPLRRGAADPQVGQRNGRFYHPHASGNSMFIREADSLVGLADATDHLLFQVPPSANMADFWAPEIWWGRNEQGQEKAYVHFATGPRDREPDRRMFVLETDASAPRSGNALLKASLPHRTWTIDGTFLDAPFRHLGDSTDYYLASELIDGEQCITIAEAPNRWSLAGETSVIVQPTYRWERRRGEGDLGGGEDVSVFPFVVEAPAVLWSRKPNWHELPPEDRRGTKLNLTYSAGGSWTKRHYCVGLAQIDLAKATGPEYLTDIRNWKKSPRPILQTNVHNQVFSPGHNSFTEDDRGQVWNVYHECDTERDGQWGPGYEARVMRAAPVGFTRDGDPVFLRGIRRGMIHLPDPNRPVASASSFEQALRSGDGLSFGM